MRDQTQLHTINDTDIIGFVIHELTIRHRNDSIWAKGLPFSTYTPRLGGCGQASYTLPLHITCKKIACKMVYMY